MRIRTFLISTTALVSCGMVSCALPALANPLGGQVVGGQATISGQGTANVVVNQQTQNAIVNWHTFNIGAGERTQFVQPNATSIILNRVTGGEGPSQIMGTIDANGRVFLVNRDGIIFGAGAQINTAGFLATTSDIRNDDFMAGRYNFSIPGRSDASIVNHGNITASNAGFAALVAPGVRNTGTITAALGTIGLAAGNTFSLDFYGDKLITLGVGDAIASQVKDVSTGQTLKSLVTNTGKLSANGGRVEITAAAARTIVDSVINTSGVIEANSVGMKNGQIVLSAATASTKGAGAPTQTVKISGKLSASGQTAGTKGGKIKVTGENIEVKNAQIDASGRDGGGTVLIGGDWGGGKPDKSLTNNQSAVLDGSAIPTASTVSVDANSVIDASAKDRGQGGKVILWSDVKTTFTGTILALGGQQFGNGGFVETSSKGQLNFLGSVDTRAPNGAAGTLLLDPADYYIVTTLGGSPTGASEMTNLQIQSLLASNNVIIATDNSSNPSGQHGDIFVNAPIVWSSSATLTLSAYRNVNISYVGGASGAIQNTGGGSLIVRADNTGTGTGTISLAAGTDSQRVNWSGSTGNVSFYYNPTSYGAPTDFTTGNGRVTTNGLVPNQFAAYMLVNSAPDLQNINANTSGAYALGKSFSAVDYTTIGSGFSGVLTGNGGLGTNYILSNLNYVLFLANHGVVRDLSLTNVNITGTGTSTGALAYLNFGTITNVELKSGTVTSTITDSHVGGLVGRNSGTINGGSSSGADISGVEGNIIGGLAGSNAGTIADSSSSGSITAGAFNRVMAGGLAGWNTTGATITNSTSNTNVYVGASTTSMQENNVGGLVGVNAGAITNSHVEADIEGGAHSNIGGLVGRNETTGTITNSTTDVDLSINGQGVQTTAGGFVGFNFGSISGISTAYGQITGTGMPLEFSAILGGFVGINATGATIANANVLSGTTVTGTTNTEVGGFVGTNQGSITNSHATGVAVVGTDSLIGGFAAFNYTTGTISDSTAVGGVVAGSGFSIGGFVGSNWGTITNSTANGVVGLTAPIPSEYTSLGGFAGDNEGTISNSFAYGSVIGSFANAANAGGFVGDNSGTITGSEAHASVTVASGNAAGGFAGSNDSVIANSLATGNVIGGGGSFLGGFVAGNLDLIQDSTASGSVTSTGANSVVGGFAAFNDRFAIIRASNTVISTGAVMGTSDSYLGGLVGYNFGLIQDSHTSTSSTVTGTGGNNIVGGLVGLNFGIIDPSNPEGNVSSGPGSLIGSVVGANGALQFSNGLTIVGLIDQPPSPNAGLVNGGAGPQVGYNYPTSGVPNAPADPCGIAFCGGMLFNPNGQGQDHFQDNINSPLLNIAAGVVNTILPEKKDEEVVKTSGDGSTPGAPGSNAGSGPTGSIPGNAGRPPVNTVPPTGLGPLPSGMPPLAETRFATNEVVMQLGLNLTPEQVAEYARQYGLEVISSHTISLLGRAVYRFRITGGITVRDAIAGLQSKGANISAQPSYSYELAQTTNRPATQGDSAQYIVPKLSLVEAHNISTGKNVKVAVIDSEIDAQHPDLAGVITGTFDALPSSDQSPHPHGTGMAGAIGSHQRLLGVAPGARILGVRAFGVSDNGAQGTSMNIVKGLEWAVSQGAQIINMSFAGPRDPILEQAIKTLRERGIILIAAAGNAGPKSPPLFPAADPNVIAVSATDNDDKTYTGAVRGRHVAIAAPGVDILVPAPAGGYQLTTGTSVAAAHMSGVVALMLERNPRLTPAEVRSILAATAKKLPQSRTDVGAGLVDPVQALSKSGPKQAQAR